MSIRIRVKMPGIDGMRRAVADNPKLSAAIAKAWSTIYRSFVRQRFLRNSRGGGDWPRLADSTLKRRRKGKGQGNAAILRDTGAMFAATQPTLGGAGLLQSAPRPLGFTAFLGGSPLATIASYHHKGDGHLPAREILVQPDAATIERMGEIGAKILAEELNREGQ